MLQEWSRITSGYNKMMNNRNARNNKIHIRQAELCDIDEIVLICRECFPDSLKNNALGPIAMRNWAHLISSPFVETYVALVDNNIAGFYVLITDIAERRKERQNILVVDKVIIWLAPLSSLLIKPFLIEKAIKKIRTKMKRLLIADPETNLNIRNEIPIDKIAWGELRATSPRYQRMGIARELNRYVINRCIELNKEVIGGKIDEMNYAARSFLESFGYVATNKVQNDIIYKKKL